MVWWNKNKRLYLLGNAENVELTPFVNSVYDIIFIFESNLAHSATPKIKNYTCFVNPTKTISIHGGIAVYIKNNLSKKLINIKYGECFITFRLDNTPHILFGGVYIQPENSKYFKLTMFSQIDSILVDCKRYNYTPFIGGDFNSRIGDINLISPRTWTYETNYDTVVNKHGRIYMSDLCRRNNVYPLNHLKYKGKTFHGDFTYYKNNKKSEIDYVLTDNTGKRFVEKFQVIDNNWQISDHRPISIEIRIDTTTSIDILLARAENLNFVFDENSTEIKRFNKRYDFQVFKNRLIQNQEAIENDVLEAIQNNNYALAFARLDTHLEDIHKASKVYKEKEMTHNKKDVITIVNNKFITYNECLKAGKNEDIQRSLDDFIQARKHLSYNILETETNRWNAVIRGKDSKQLWKLIDWNGSVNNNNIASQPNINSLKNHFKNIYQAENPSEIANITEVTTNVCIPLLDDPIIKADVDEAMKNCKKGGYDYLLPILQMLVSHMLPLILILFNIMFYTIYPLKLACSLLFAIPKKGNLKIPSNFRGIQMLPSLGVLYDRIIYNRLERWVNIHEEQSGFQKGKSTIKQIFTVRLIIELAKKTKTELYIGCFDIEKAFDKVSRLLLLQKLVKIGIGYSMLHALKAIYTTTSCILHMRGKNSTEFKTSCGIRQGAPSSALLFIVFINDLIDFVQTRCIPEAIIDTMHILLHADDTIVLSTNVSLFIKKCNVMIEYFDINKLKLNLGKSGFTIIGGNINDKHDILLSNGSLEYK